MRLSETAHRQGHRKLLAARMPTLWLRLDAGWTVRQADRAKWDGLLKLPPRSMRSSEASAVS